MNPDPAAPDRRGAREELRKLGDAGLLRRMRTVEGAQGPRVTLDGAEVLLLCSNNYLGLAEHPRVRLAGAEAYRDLGAGAGASRLISGNMTAHERLEHRLAGFHGREAALLFGSGYLANTGVIAALARRGEVVYSDALNHASIIDGCRLAGSAKFVYRHRDIEHLAWAMDRCAAPASLIVTDGIFSMDGDTAPVMGLLELARKHGARLMVDEAHAVGTYGPRGRGVAAAAGLAEEVDVISGTLGKALGGYGAYVVADRDLRDLLVNRARSVVFSTGLPPAVVRAAETALELVDSEPERIERLRRNAETLRQALADEGMPVDSETQILPLQLGDPSRAVAASGRALDAGVYVQAIRPPTVPVGGSRLRMTVMASHEPAELRAAATVIADATRAVAADSEWAIDIPEPAGEPVIYRVEDRRPEPEPAAPPGPATPAGTDGGSRRG
jgi:8-amino-7-oxononanoate synthase